MLLLYIKIKNAFVYLIHLLFFSRIESIPAKTKSNTLLLIRLDAIGDYLLFRNFIEVIKKSKRFNNYSITLCGNVLWKDLAETFDHKFIDEFIWIDRKKFYGDFKYKYQILKKIRGLGFETAMDLTYSREILYGDTIIRASAAKIRIGSEGAKDSYVVWKRNLLSDKYYTEIIPLEEKDLFEFNRNKELLEKILCETINIYRPTLDVSGIQANKAYLKPYAAVFFGASSTHKIWDIKYFIDIAKFLIEKYSYNIILTGSSKEKKNSHLFLEALPADKVTDLCDKTTLPELSKVLSESEILISNESVAVHIASSVNKKFVCISNGERIGRFHPYPKEIFKEGFYVYPDEIMSNLGNPDYLSRFRFGSDLNINSVKPEKVEAILEQII